jgi:FkbM family methyltransferase
MVKQIGKRLRAVPVLNATAALPLRAAMRATGRSWEPVIRHLPRSGTIKERLPNGQTLTLVSRGDDWVPNQVFWRGWQGFEPEMSSLFFDLARRARTTLDVGAYIGFYALLAGHANPHGTVLAFEPVERIVERLRLNVAANHLRNVEVVSKAVGRRSGRAQFYAIPSGIPSSSSLSQEFMSFHRDAVPNEVDVVQLDQLVAERDLNVDLVKIDTETTEPDVLAGMAETLERDRPDVFVEVLEQADTEAMDAVVLPLGYRLVQLSPRSGRIERQSLQEATGNWHLVPPGRAPGL